MGTIIMFLNKLYNFFSLLTIALIVLRLTGSIDWPWVLVLWPVWTYAGIVLASFIVGFLIGDKKRRR